MKNIMLSFGGLSLFLTPGISSARSEAAINSSSIGNYSEEELTALIAKLQRQLEEVRKNKVQCALADVDLSIGDGDGDNLREHVRGLQGFLKEKGFLATEPTGYFGKLTRAALIGYQKSAGVEQSGELNSSVRGMIKNQKCKKDYYIKKIEVQEKNKEYMSSAGAVTSIALTGTGSSVTWSTSGYSKNGFKVVWSKNPNPTYPNRDGDRYIYLSEPSARTTNLEAFNGTGTYYVRTCEYLGGSCGVYSNEISVSL